MVAVEGQLKWSSRKSTGRVSGAVVFVQGEVASET